MKLVQSIVVLLKIYKKSLRKRTDERKTVYSPLLNFLKNPNKEPDFDKDLDTILKKSELKALILRFTKGPKKKFYITRPL